MSLHETTPFSRRKAAERAEAETQAWLAEGNQIRRCAPGESAYAPVKIKSHNVQPRPDVRPDTMAGDVLQAMRLHGGWVNVTDLKHVCPDAGRCSSIMTRLVSRSLVRRGARMKCRDGKVRTHYKAHKNVV